MIEVRGLSVEVPGFALRNVDLSVNDGGFFALIGPTGSGKSLLLEALAGLMPVRSGKVLLDGRDVTGLPPENRGLGIVYQDCALFPHLSVRKNIAYGLRYHKVDDSEAGKRVRRLADRLAIGHLLERGTSKLSGGERQRVALARALVVEPKVLLLDEPMSALDPAFRQGVQRMIHELHKELDLTFLMVSHNFDEVLNLADRAAVIRDGALEQTGGVREIFERPGNAFVADFVGMKNVLPVSSNGGSVLCGELEIRPCRANADAEYAAFRPEEVVLRLPGESEPGANAFDGVVTGVFPRGFSLEVEVDVRGKSLLAIVTRRRADKLGLEPGLEVLARVPEEAVHLF